MTEFEQVVEIGQARNIVRDYVCAQCWGQLAATDAHRHGVLRITCLKCGDERGMVTREFVNRKRAENRAELVDARRNLAQAMGIKTTTHNQGDLIKALYG